MMHGGPLGKGLMVAICLPLCILIFIVAKLFVGIFVYNDAKKAKINSAGLWALASALAPCCVGMISYLIVRTVCRNKVNDIED